MHLRSCSCEKTTSELFAADSFSSSRYRVGEPDDAELVERTYLDLLHTCNRWDGLDALARVSPKLLAIHAHDALWDCAGGVRWHAIGVSPPSSRDRLEEIALDPFEEEEHRETARKRLSELTPV